MSRQAPRSTTPPHGTRARRSPLIPDLSRPESAIAVAYAVVTACGVIVLAAAAVLAEGQSVPGAITATVRHRVWEAFALGIGHIWTTAVLLGAIFAAVSALLRVFFGAALRLLAPSPREAFRAYDLRWVASLVATPNLILLWLLASVEPAKVGELSALQAAAIALALTGAALAAHLPVLASRAGGGRPKLIGLRPAAAVLVASCVLAMILAQIAVRV